MSKGGRLVLIKSSLSNFPTYFMSLFPIPRKFKRLFVGKYGGKKKDIRKGWEDFSLRLAI